MPILIGNNLFIEELSIDYSGKLLELDPYIVPLQALIFDSVYNSFRGVETYFRVMNGEIRKGQKIKFMSNGKIYDADEVGTLKINQLPKQVISAGDVGYLITSIKGVREAARTHTAPAVRHTYTGGYWG